MCVDPYEKYSSELTPLLLGWRRCVVFDRRLLLSRRRRRRLSARPRSQSSAPRRSAWPAKARCQSACRKSSRTAPPRDFSKAKVWDHPSLGRRTSCRAPHQKCQKSRFAHTRRLWGHPTGRAAAMRRAVTRKITTGWATRAGPPSVWPPRFRHPTWAIRIQRIYFGAEYAREYAYSLRPSTQ